MNYFHMFSRSNLYNSCGHFSLIKQMKLLCIYLCTFNILENIKQAITTKIFPKTDTGFQTLIIEKDQTAVWRRNVTIIKISEIILANLLILLVCY